MHYILALFLIFLSFDIEKSTARQLRISTVEAEPFYMRKSDGSYEGYLVDLIEDLLSRSNVGTDEEHSARFYLAPDGKYGSMDERGRWNGMIGQVIDGEQADMAAAPITVTKARAAVVYFSHPFMPAMTVPMIKKPVPGAHWPFKNLTDLYSKLQSGELTLGYVEHGSTQTLLSNHKLPLIRQIYNISKSSHTESPFVQDYETGVGRVRRSGGRFVFYGEHPQLQRLVNTNPCDLALAWQGSIQSRYYAFAFPATASGRQWVDRFNQLLLAAEEDGTLGMLVNRWWDQKSVCKTPDLCMCHQDSH